MDIEQKVKAFQEMESQTQIKICVKILSGLSERGNADAARVLPQVKEQDVSSELLISVYRNFLQAVKKSKDKKKEAETVQLKRWQSHIAELKEKEMTQREEELIEAEKLFENITTMENEYTNHNLWAKQDRPKKNKGWKRWKLLLILLIIGAIVYRQKSYLLDLVN